MGIYDDIQNDLKTEMDIGGDLYDAVATLTITESGPSTVYDPQLGEPIDDPEVNAMRCIVQKNMKGENLADDTQTNYITVIVLDSEKTVDFKIGMLANVRGYNYEIKGYNIDAVGATHKLKCRRR